MYSETVQQKGKFVILFIVTQANDDYNQSITSLAIVPEDGQESQIAPISKVQDKVNNYIIII